MSALKCLTTEHSEDPTVVTRRPFRLSDAMILMAATGAACALIQWANDAMSDTDLWPARSEIWDAFRHFQNSEASSIARGRLVLAQTALKLALLSIPFLCTWTLALIAMRIAKPRPERRQLWSQPGTTAACAAVLASVYLGLHLLGGSLIMGREGASEHFHVVEAFLYTPMFGGLAVCSSWATLAVAGRWQLQADWVDGLGRTAGFLWILEGFVVPALFLYVQWNQSICQ